MFKLQDKGNKFVPALLLIPSGRHVGLPFSRQLPAGFLLSPLLLVLRWASARQMAAATTVLILANSAAALAGNVASVGSLPSALPLWAAAVLIGGVCGAELAAGGPSGFGFGSTPGALPFLTFGTQQFLRGRLCGSVRC